MAANEEQRRLGKAWRNAGLAAVAIGVLVVGTQGVLALVDTGEVAANSEAALEECGPGEVARVSDEGFACRD